MVDWTNVDLERAFLEPGASLGSASLPVTGHHSDQAFMRSTRDVKVLDRPDLDQAAIEQLARDALVAHLRVSPYLPPSLSERLLQAVKNPGSDDQKLGSAIDELTPNPSQEAPSGHPLERLLNSFPNGDSEGRPSGPDEVLALGSGYHYLIQVGDRLRDQLVEQHGIPLELAEDMCQHSQESAVCHLLTVHYDARELQSLTVSLYGRGAITPTLLLRSLCYGQIEFFEAALAVMARIPLAQAHLQIAARRPEELLGLYEQAGLPLRLFRAFRGAIDVIHAAKDTWQDSHGELPRAELCDLIIARWVKDYGDICPEGLDYVMTQFARFSNDSRDADPATLVRAS